MFNLLYLMLKSWDLLFKGKQFILKPHKDIKDPEIIRQIHDGARLLEAGLRKIVECT